jgi:hypothetical protein
VVPGSAVLVQIAKCDFLSAEDIQDEGADGEQGGHKDRKVYGEKQEDKKSGKETNFYFPGLTPFFISDISGQTWADYENSGQGFVNPNHSKKMLRMVERSARKKQKAKR